MGAESFQVLITSGSAAAAAGKNVASALGSIAGVFPAVGDWPSPGYSYYEYHDGAYTIEIEIAPQSEKGGLWVSCRFAICNPQAIDDIFIRFVLSLATLLGGRIEIVDDVPPGAKYKFDRQAFVEFVHVARKSIEIKRHYWKADFGDDEVIATCREACIWIEQTFGNK